MQPKTRFASIIGLLLLSLVSGHYLGVSPSSAGSLAQEENLLKNPGFEGKFHAWNGISEIQVAANWTPWWWEDADHNPAYFRPEYKRAVAAFYPNRVLSGESAQQWFTFHASHLAGMYQQVFNARPGQLYRFTIWAQVWSSVEDNPHSSVFPANPHLQVGIDPTGYWNAGSADVIWSSEASMSGVIDQWGQIEVEGRAQGNIITVFMRTNPDFANKHNDIYWDNASLVAISSSPPTPMPATMTTVPGVDPILDTQTATPEQTQIPATFSPPLAASVTPAETVSPIQSPSPTDTRIPTHTPRPTRTIAPSRTATPAPTQIQTATTFLEKTATAFVPTRQLTGPAELAETGDVTTGATKASSMEPTLPDPESERGEEHQSNNDESRSKYLLIVMIGLAIVVGYGVITRIVRGNRSR